MSASEIVKQYCGDFQKSDDAFSEHRERWKRYQRAYAGEPFDKAVTKKIRETDRVISNFNFALSTINALIGQEQADRKEAQFSGIDKSPADAFAGELFTDLVRHLFLRAKGHRQLSRAQLDQLTTGYGWLSVFMDATVFPFRPAVRHVDVFKIWPDPDYEEDNCHDGRYVIHKTQWDIEDAVARWPKSKSDLETLYDAGQGKSGQTGAPKLSRGDWLGYSKGPSDTHFRGRSNERKVSISRYEYRESEPWVAFENPENDKEERMPQKQYDELLKKIGGQPSPKVPGKTVFETIQAVTYLQMQPYGCWIAGTAEENSIVLEPPKRIADEMFTYRCATGYAARDENSERVYHFGLMSLIYEPQLWTTKTISAIIDFISKQQKGGGFYKKSALSNARAFPNDTARPGAWIEVTETAIIGVDIVPNPPPQWPQAYEKLLDFCINAQPKLTNVTDADKGTMTGERSNVLISNLQQHSQIVLNPLIEPLGQLQLDVSMLLAKFSQHYVANANIDRILGERECEGVTYIAQPDPMTGVEQKIPLMVAGPIDPMTGQPTQRPVLPSDIVKKADLLDFDVEIDLGSASVTSKQAFISTMMQTAFGKTLNEMGVLDRFLPIIVESWPGIPANKAKKLAAELEADSQARRAMQNPQALMQAIAAMAPEQQVQLAQQMGALLQQQGIQPPQPPPMQAPPAGGEQANVAEQGGTA
jgi:hypothetical protein